MRVLKSYADSRQSAWCPQCGGKRGTRDHIPPKVFLDEPYPENLVTIDTCERCNNRPSDDELYVACLIDCVISGSASPADVSRVKTRRAFDHNPALAARLAKARKMTVSGVTFETERKRIERVILKLARAHSLYDLGEPHFEKPNEVTFAPLMALSPEGRAQFDANFQSAGELVVWPEVGSRAMQRIVMEGGNAWVQVQEGRYRYFTSVEEGVVVRMVLSEYLAAEVMW